jgi:hypothetical protein
MSALFKNNAVSTLAAAITAGATSLTVQTADASLFPQPSAGDWFPVTVFDGTNMEIMRCTARSGATLTVTRAQEGTTARAFSAGAKVEHRITAATLLAFLQAGDAPNDGTLYARRGGAWDQANAVWVGATHPLSGDGTLGDFFISLAENQMFGPKGSAPVVPGEGMLDGRSPAGTTTGSAGSVGTQFQCVTSGRITALKFYRVSGDTTTSRKIILWSDAGTKLAEVVTSGESGTGWQAVSLPTPINVTAGSNYRLAYNILAATPYASTLAETSGISALTILNSCYGGPDSFPNTLYHDANFWADVIYEPSSTDPWPLALSGGIGEAPSDNAYYLRRNKVWTPLSSGLLVETGTWTPSWINATTNPSSVTYSTRLGYYWKFGNLVVIQGHIRTSGLTVGSASGQCIISGLPYAAGAFDYASIDLGYASTFTTQSPTRLLIPANASGIYCYNQTATSMTAITQANYVAGAGNEVMFGGVYRSAS